MNNSYKIFRSVSPSFNLKIQNEQNNNKLEELLLITSQSDKMKALHHSASRRKQLQD